MKKQYMLRVTLTVVVKLLFHLARCYCLLNHYTFVLLCITYTFKLILNVIFFSWWKYFCQAYKKNLKKQFKIIYGRGGIWCLKIKSICLYLPLLVTGWKRTQSCSVISATTNQQIVHVFSYIKLTAGYPRPS